MRFELQQFVDADLRAQAKALGYLLSCEPHGEGEAKACKTFHDLTVANDRVTLIPRSEWDGILASPTQMSTETLVRKIKNQRQEGSCACNASCQQYEIIHNLHYGKDKWIEFSPISLYKALARNGNSGTVILHNLKRIQEVGLLPVSSEANKQLLTELGLNPRHVMPETGISTPWPDGYAETAKHFRCDEFFKLNTFDEIASCLLLDIPVVYGRSGHAITAVQLVKRSNVYYIKYANSWAPSWGEEGYGYDSERSVAPAVPGYGAFAVLTQRHLPLIDVPPVVAA